jgi:membrane-associated phospholipid phosphatase
VPYLSIFALMPLSFFACRDAAALQRHAHRLLLALALAVVAYAAFPLGFQSQRPQPEGPFAMLFGLLWALDLPYNRSPSLHITVLLLIWPLLVARLAGRWQRLTAHAWLTTIGVSVLTTYQHHVLDIAGGACLAGACVALTGCRVQRAWRAVQVMRSATLPIVAPRRCQNG